LASIPKIGARHDRLDTINQIVDNPAEFEKLPGAEDGVRPWWPWHNPPKDLAPRDEPAGDYYLQEVTPDHWVRVWRTAAARDHESTAADMTYRSDRAASVVTAGGGDETREQRAANGTPRAPRCAVPPGSAA